MRELQLDLIRSAFEGQKELSEASVEAAVQDVIEALDNGECRVATQTAQGEWQVEPGIKEAILLYFRIQKMEALEMGGFHFVDKIPLKKWTGQEGVRVVPHALVRKGAFVEKGAILMPSYVNIGAYVGSGTMVDTWATVGSCAQIGQNVHLSGGVGIGGVLEPVQASPVIVEDEVFIGSRCIVVEGARIRRRAVLGAGVVVTSSTRVIDVSGSEEKIYRGEVPEGAVVIPGTSVKRFPAGEYAIPSALIIGYRNAQTDNKTSLTAALRDFDLAV